MNPVKFLLGLAVLLVSCRASRQSTVQPSDYIASQTMAYVVSPVVPSNTLSTDSIVEADDTTALLSETDAITTVAATKQVYKKAASFAQLKEMVKNGEVTMSKKDQRILHRLDKHYKGNFNHFRSDAFELTDKAKIIGGIGIVGLLIGIFTGSAFGWFIFILALFAFLLRYLDIIAF
jgi:hypothetical protein